MNKAFLVFSNDMKTYSVSRLDSLGSNDAGEQIQNRSPLSLDLAIYDKGTKVVKKLNEDSYTIAIIHVHTLPKVLNSLDDITYDGRVYTVLDVQHRSDHSFYRAVANV